MEVEGCERDGEKKRSRKKQLYQDIAKQVEFYLSSANLSKDRFMSQALQENPDGLELSVLLRCNKLRSLTTDINVLKKALKLSNTLELTDNNLRVKSKIPFQPKQNVDECTVYVERVPLDATIDYMHQVFSQYGSVDYVSLPKFPNGKIKGFGFIEFSDPESAEKTIQEFKKSGCYLSIDMDPFNLRSVCTLDKKTKEALLKGRNRTDEEFANHSMEKEEDMNVVTKEIQQVGIEAKTNNDSVEEEESESEKKRKHKTSPSTLERKKKKVKKEETTENLSEDKPKSPVSYETTTCPPNKEDCSVKSDVSKQDVDKEQEESGHSSGDDVEGDENKNKKKRRQKKKARKSHGNPVGMMILSKADWKKLRNMYLNSQRAKMRIIKKHLYKCRQQSNMDYCEQGSQDSFEHDDINPVEIPGSVVQIELDQPVIDVKTFKSEIRKQSEDIVNIDVKEGVSQVYVRFKSSQSALTFTQTTQHKFYIIQGEEELNYWLKIHQDRENKKDKKNKKNHKEPSTEITDVIIEDSCKKQISKGLLDKPKLNIESGTIVRLETSQPIVDIKNFKTGIKKSNSTVIYIDIKEGSDEAYIRFDSPESAKLFAGPNNPFGCAVLLTGLEEQTYIDKINEDRTNKFNKSVRIKKRGKHKVISKAEKLMGKHIILDTEELDPSCMECVEME